MNLAHSFEDCFVRLRKQQQPITSAAMLNELHNLLITGLTASPLHDDIALIVVKVNA